MAKKLKAKVNGVNLKDGDKVTLVIQATVKITDQTGCNGGTYRDVEFVSGNKEQYVDAWEDEKEFKIGDVTVVKH